MKTKERQTIFDIALQCCGSIEAAFAMAAANDIGLTETLPNDIAVNGVGTIAINKRIVKYYTDRRIVPATALQTDSESQTTITMRAVYIDDFYYNPLDFVQYNTYEI